MTCWEIVQAYALRSLGIGERLLPQVDITLCHQFTLIGSGLLWNVYFGTLALGAGFFLAVATALARQSRHAVLRKPAEWFVFVFRGSPLFIQFFFAYFLFLSLRGTFPALSPLTSAAYGALFVLFLNTAAYSAEIFHGALQAIPRGDLEAADAYGLAGWRKFRRITFPTMLRLGWPAYTNEAIFLFHATTLVFFSGFPAAQQRGDALYYAKFFADRTFNPFVPYPILAGYFILLTLGIIALAGLIQRRLNRHLPAVPGPWRPRFRLVR
ncbi:ABC transporter permease [Rubellimicrobium sp. CFH 75288]|uniref:ABC transporter permease n=1 Tax=Rubellimicrobium sp. CFH 75288 TaxID=2697034 RepID=UPI0014123E18|nr:ABC transporter permease subunit [Rubellimicrobium sp. CFH 75288]NAZ37080.1 ABC transporter permease subunit [Rubellimicrobium sp. CFH 75288]